MSPVIQCHKCGERFEPFPLRDIGTFWQPLFAGDCPECGEETRVAIEADMGFRDIDEFIVNSVGPEQPSRKYAKPIDERVADDEVREYWVQQYIAANYRELGFDALQGPFDSGPDFLVSRDGRWIVAEAEVTCENYVRHKHHESRKWARCEILIVLERDEPADEIKAFLPATIVHLDKARFVAWYEPAAREYALAREAEWPARRAAKIMTRKLEMLDREIRKRFDIPAGGEYGEDVFLGAHKLSRSLTIEFVTRWMKDRNEFMLAEISAEAIDEFCASVAPEVNEMLPDLGVPPGA